MTQPVKDRCTGCLYSRQCGAGCAATRPHAEAEEACARDEAVAWLAQHYAGEDLHAGLEWMLAWANARARQVHHEHVVALRSIANDEPDIEIGDAERVQAARLIARMALRWSTHV